METFTAKQTFLVVGINWQTSPVKIREQMAFSEKVIPETLRTIRRFSGATEVAILSTCNRVEIYAATEDAKHTRSFLLDFLASFHDGDDTRFDQYCYMHEARAAAQHLFSVASGLDSMVVGENEILHQVKEAYRIAAQETAVGGLLALLFEHSLKVGREVRARTKINRGSVSVASVACELAEQIFDDLADRRVLVLGTGEMGKQTLKHLVDRRIGELVIASRDVARGELLARPFGARAVDFSEWLRYLPEADILIVSTAAPHYVVTAEDIRHVVAARRHKPVFIIDISVPRNVAPEVDQLDDVYLYNIDDLAEISNANLKLRRREMHAAEVIITDRVGKFYTHIEKLKAAPTIEALSRKFDELAEAELTETMRKLSAGAGEAEEIRALIARIKGKFLHHPMTRLKAAAENGGVYRHSESMRHLFNLDSAEGSVPPKKS